MELARWACNTGGRGVASFLRTSHAFSSLAAFSLFVRRLAERISQRDHEGFLIRLVEHQRQVTAVFNLRVKFSKLIRDGADDAPAHVRKNERHVSSHDLWIA